MLVWPVLRDGLRILPPQTTRNKPATKIDMNALEQDIHNYPDAYQYGAL